MFKSMKIKTKTKENRTQQNYKFLLLKLLEPVGQVQFVVWKIYKYLLHQIAEEIMLLLVIMYMKKTLQKVKTDEILKACANYLFL